MLSPQHLQAQDRFFEGLVEFQLSASTAFPWGFLEIELDEDAIEAGTVGVVRASGIMPDGLMFSMPDADRTPEPLAFSEAWPEDAEAATVYLAIPERRPAARNVGSRGNGGGFRFSAEAVELRDDNTGLAGRPIELAAKNFRLALEGQVAMGHALLPIVRIRRTSSGFVRDGAFIPPALAVGAAPALRAVVRRLVELMVAKGSELAEGRSERQKGMAHFGATDVARFWLLHTINTYLPEGRHFLHVPQTHPVQVFDWMLGLAGALTTFSRDIDVSDLPTYDHADLSRCFEALDEAVRVLLGTVLPTRHASVPLSPKERSIYTADLHDDRFLRAEQYYLAVATGLDAGEMAVKVPRLMKVSSADRIEQVTDHGLPGLPLTHMSSPPSALPVRMDYTYFRIDPQGEHWDAVRRSGRLAVYVPDELTDVRMELNMLLHEQDVT